MAYPSRFRVSVPLGSVERPGDDTPPQGAFLQASNRAADPIIERRGFERFGYEPDLAWVPPAVSANVKPLQGTVVYLVKDGDVLRISGFQTIK
jgi:hypothetical protein